MIRENECAGNMDRWEKVFEKARQLLKINSAKVRTNLIVLKYRKKALLLS